MSVYAPVPPYAQRKPHPRTLVLIVAGHAALIAALMLVKMDLPQRFVPTVTRIDLIPEPTPPPPNPEPKPKAAKQAARPVIDQPAPLPPIPHTQLPPLDMTPVPLPIPQQTSPEPTQTHVAPAAEPVRTGPRFRTPASDVKPPYPQSKLRSGEEASLQLRLTIDARGRVTAVEPVGAADPTFLAAARRHILAHWRYQPAEVDGRAVASSTVITLRFELDE